MTQQSRQKNPILLTDEELSALCWQLAQLCRAGVPWSEGAQLLLEDAASPNSRHVLQTIAAQMQEGAQLASVMEQTQCFPAYFLHMIEIGQLSGRMDQVLEALSHYYRRQDSMSDAIRRAVTYPAVMSALIAMVFLILVIRVLPVFSKVFASLGTGVSSAVYLLGTSSAGKYIAIGLAAVLLLMAVLLLVLFRGRRGVRLFSHGSTAQSIARGQFASAMAMLLSSGIALDEAMDRTQALLADTPLTGRIKECSALMMNGVAFHKAVSDTHILSGLQAGMLAAGFRTGHSDTAMEELAERCSAEAEERLERMLGYFEYGLVIVLCVAVGLVLLSVMLPLLGVLSAIGG